MQIDARSAALAVPHVKIRFDLKMTVAGLEAGNTLKSRYQKKEGSIKIFIEIYFVYMTECIVNPISNYYLYK